MTTGSLADSWILDRMTDQHLEPPPAVKKRPSSEALNGRDAKRANQAKEGSQELSAEEEVFDMDIAEWRYKHEQRKLGREKDDPQEKKREEKPVRQRRRPVTGI